MTMAPSYLNVTEFDSPEEVEIESDEGDHERGDDGDGAPSSTDSAGAESVADDHVAFDGYSNDEPDGVVADGVQRHRAQLARPLRQRLHVQPPRLRSHRIVIRYITARKSHANMLN